MVRWREESFGGTTFSIKMFFNMRPMACVSTTSPIAVVSPNVCKIAFLSASFRSAFSKGWIKAHGSFGWSGAGAGAVAADPKGHNQDHELSAGAGAGAATALVGLCRSCGSADAAPWQGDAFRIHKRMQLKKTRGNRQGLLWTLCIGVDGVPMNSVTLSFGAP